MILDTLDNAGRYASLHPGFAAALAFLRRADPASLAPGRHEVDGARLYVIAECKEGRGCAGARLEVHRNYIDIQFAVEGADEIGWVPADECRDVAAQYDPAKDVAFFADAPKAWIAVPPGSFAVFFPEDAHAPLGATGPICKLIAKVAVQPRTAD